MSKKTDIAKIVDYIDPPGRKITHFQAVKKWGMLAFNSRISDIRRMCRTGEIKNRILLSERKKTNKGISISEHSFI